MGVSRFFASSRPWLSVRLALDRLGTDACIGQRPKGRGKARNKHLSAKGGTLRNALRFILPGYLAFFLFCAGSFPFAYADDWQVKRTDRAPILIKRWTEILQNEPYAQKAFRELLRLHKQPATRRSLYARWKARYESSPNSLSAAIIYARSLQRQGQHTEALRLWQDIAKRSTQKQAPLLRIASIHLDQKRPREAMTTFQQLLPLVSESQRPKLLLRILEVSLKARDDASLAWTQPQIAKITWSTSQQHTIAQLYEQYQRWADASALLRPLYANAKGAERLRLALRLSRVEMNQKRYKHALQLVQEARKVGTLHEWMRWELLEREAEIYRHRKELPTLAERLAQTWKRSKDTRELLFLARLYRENKQDAEAIELAQRVLRLKPALREPRLWLVEHYTKEQDFSTVNEHIQALVKYGHARPSHMIQLADSFLRNSGRPLKSRWTPIHLFQSSSSSYSAYRRRLYYRRRYTAPPNTAQDAWSPQAIRKSILQWDTQRREEWTTWARYATNAARKDYNQAKKILEQTLRRYPKDWDTLFKIEYMADQMGASTLANQALRALERATDADPNQLKQMHVLLLQTQREEKLTSLAKRALSPPLAPLQAILASAWALRPWDELRGSYKKMTRFSKTSQQTSMATPDLPSDQAHPPTRQDRQDARPRRLPPPCACAFKSTPCVGIAANATTTTRTQLERAEEALLLESDGPQKLLETYVRARLDQPLRSYLKRRKLAENPRDLIEMFRPLLQSPWAKQATDALFAAFSGERSESHQNARAEALLLLCQQRAHCNHVADAIGSLVKSPPKPITPLLQIIERTATFQLFPKERAAWLTQTPTSLHHDDLPVQYFLATQKSLFLHPIQRPDLLQRLTDHPRNPRQSLGQGRRPIPRLARNRTRRPRPLADLAASNALSTPILPQRTRPAVFPAPPSRTPLPFDLP
jgi:tetratricopeptide (TPR) repeat protein